MSKVTPTAATKRAPAKPRPQLRIQAPSAEQIQAAQSEALDRLSKMEGWAQTPALQGIISETPQNAPEPTQKPEGVGKGAQGAEVAATPVSASPEPVVEDETEAKGQGRAVKPEKLAPTKRAGSAKTTVTAKPGSEGEQMPWDKVADGEEHAYHVKLPKAVFLKAQHCWRRMGYESLKDYVVAALDQSTKADLKTLRGE